jgi:riboflavin kinase/FMN adenylyltransferase
MSLFTTPPALINSKNDRITLMRDFGMEEIRVLPTSKEVMSTSWQDFLEELLSCDAIGFVCGDDFRFGFRGEGNSEKLKSFCQPRGLPCVMVPEQTVDGIRVSSTYIRRQIETGDMATAVRFLGHPYILTGEVVPGKQLGRKLGFPTANLYLPEHLAIPRFGVYACRVNLDGIYYPAVTNIGTRPTVSGQGITVEPWILDYSGDLYGQEITLEFFHFLRPERSFESLEALRQEILSNAQTSRELLKTYEGMF